MANKNIWFGFLNAGRKSSPVVRDRSLETSGTKTIFLYNHAKGGFLEYARELVEPKLRELTDDDTDVDELERAFREARKAFVADRPAHKWKVARESSSTPKTPAIEEPDIEEPTDPPIELDGDFEAEELEA